MISLLTVAITNVKQVVKFLPEWSHDAELTAAVEAAHADLESALNTLATLMARPR